jgi:hypothetical protein
MSSSTSKPAPTVGGRVLIVEDEYTLADAIACGLRREGMTVDVAADDRAPARPVAPSPPSKGLRRTTAALSAADAGGANRGERREETGMAQSGSVSEERGVTR